MPKSTYRIHIEHTSKYDCSALLIDTTAIDKPEQTTLMAKSMEELLAKLLIAVVLRDKNAGVSAEPPAEGAANGDKPIILVPNRKVTR